MAISYYMSIIYSNQVLKYIEQVVYNNNNCNYNFIYS